MTASVDLNADVGEGFPDAGLMPYLSSCNIACGAHAGELRTMSAALVAARAAGVSCGAHPGYPDREAFGRREMAMTLSELSQTVTGQIETLASAARSARVPLRHVKPHGALYHACARRRDIARALAEAVARHDTRLVLVGFAGSVLVEEGSRAGLRAEGEAFADRQYAVDGSLTPRGRPGALIEDPDVAAAQALSIVRDRAVTASDGGRLSVEAQTICLHGDTPGAVAIAKAVRAALEGAGIEIRAIGGGG
jgi:UPF0271 protein